MYTQTDSYLIKTRQQNIQLQLAMYPLNFWEYTLYALTIYHLQGIPSLPLLVLAYIHIAYFTF